MRPELVPLPLYPLYTVKAKGIYDVKKLRSYSSVWKVEQVIYSFGDAKLPTPVTVTQLLWLAASGVHAPQSAAAGVYS